MSTSAALPSTDTLEISVQDACKHLSATEGTPYEQQVHWVDCRESDEHELCHINGTCLIPLSNFAAVMEQSLPEDKNQPIIVHCHHGMRSLKATNFLRQKGYPNTWSMSGGIDKWSQEIDPTVPRY